MSSVRSHLPPELLASYALGETAPSWSLLAACHLTFCETCRTKVHLLEEAAGAHLQSGDGEDPSASVASHALSHLLDRLDAVPPNSSPANRPQDEVQGLPVPRPLGRWLAEQAGRGDQIALKALGPGVRYLSLRPAPSERPSALETLGNTAKDTGHNAASNPEKVRARLLLFRPRYSFPAHRHAGPEHTLVLAGGFSDGEQHYARGDVASPTPHDTHAPQIDDDGPCLVLAVNDGPIIPTSFAHRMLLKLVGN